MVGANPGSIDELAHGDEPEPARAQAVDHAGQRGPRRGTIVREHVEQDNRAGPDAIEDLGRDRLGGRRRMCAIRRDVPPHRRPLELPE